MRGRPVVLVELGLVEQRVKAVHEVLEGATVVDVARRNRVARQTVHDWLRRYANQGLAGLPTTAPNRRRARTRCHPRSRPASWSCAGPTRAGGHGPSPASSVVTAWTHSPAARRSIGLWSATASSIPPLGAGDGVTTSAGSGPARWSCGRW